MTRAFSHELCTRALHTSFCKQALYTSFAHELCTRALHTGFAQSLVHELLHTGFVHGLLHTSFAHGICIRALHRRAFANEILHTRAFAHELFAHELCTRTFHTGFLYRLCTQVLQITSHTGFYTRAFALTSLYQSVCPMYQSVSWSFQDILAQPPP